MAGNPFTLGDKVTIDDGDVIGTVIGIAIYTRGAEIRVSWWHNGDIVEKWVADWRCQLKTFP